MKKIMALFLICIVYLQVPAYTIETFELDIVDYEIEINDVMVETEKSQYPILNYKEVTYLPITWQNLKALGLSVKFDSSNVYFDKVEIVDGYLNGEEKKNFQSSFTAVLPERNIYIDNHIFDNANEKYPILEYSGVLYIPINEAFAKDIFGLDIKIAPEFGLKINSDLYDDEVVIEENLTELEKQHRNKKIIEDALNLEKSLVARLEDEEPTKVFTNAKDYTIQIDDSKIVGFRKWDDGAVYAGEFENEKANGIGVFTWSNGRKYVGEFKDDDFNGVGRYYYSDNSRSKISEFKDGVMLSSKLAYIDKPIEYSENQNVLVILTEFKNLKLRTSEEEWKNYMYGDSNSVKSYYEQESIGKLNIKAVEETSGTANDGIIRVRLDYFHPDFDDSKIERFSLTRDSLEKANEFIDFEKYDSNGNGFIDRNELTIFNVIAGYEYRKGVDIQSVYAHRGSIREGNTIFDDTDIQEYIMIGELHYDRNYDKNAYMATTGVAVHEMGHAYGLPDLYDIDYSSNGIGPYGIMGTATHESVNGTKPGQVPVSFSAWSKVKLGFVEPTIVENDGNYDLYTDRTGNYNILKVAISESEYLLIENKNYDHKGNILNKKGRESGILIWHVNNDVINENYSKNAVNSDESNKGVDLVESDATKSNFSQLDEDYTDRNFYPFFKYNGISDYKIKVEANEELGTSESLISIDVLKDGDEAEVRVRFN